MREASYGDAVVFFYKQYWILSIFYVSTAGRVKEPDSDLWVCSPLRSLIVSKLCEIYIKKTWHAADVIFNALPLINMAVLSWVHEYSNMSKTKLVVTFLCRIHWTLLHMLLRICKIGEPAMCWSVGEDWHKTWSRVSGRLSSFGLKSSWLCLLTSGYHTSYLIWVH